MTMKYILPVALVFLLTCWAGNALKCYACVGDCRSPQTLTCPGGTRCLDITVEHGKEKYESKSCSPSLLCDQPFDTPPGFPKIKPRCCDTDLCNSAVSNMVSLVIAAILPLVSLYLSQF
ncbi:uncharacterized protein PAF06_020138 [Gastrophryne carolinensis]